MDSNRGKKQVLNSSERWSSLVGEPLQRGMDLASRERVVLDLSTVHKISNYVLTFIPFVLSGLAPFHTRNVDTAVTRWPFNVIVAPTTVSQSVSGCM
jgi:hypothetical protein